MVAVVADAAGEVVASVVAGVAAAEVVSPADRGHQSAAHHRSTVRHRDRQHRRLDHQLPHRGPPCQALDRALGLDPDQTSGTAILVREIVLRCNRGIGLVLVPGDRRSGHALQHCQVDLGAERALDQGTGLVREQALRIDRELGLASPIVRERARGLRIVQVSRSFQRIDYRVLALPPAREPWVVQRPHACRIKELACKTGLPIVRTRWRIAARI